MGSERNLLIPKLNEDSKLTCVFLVILADFTYSLSFFFSLFSLKIYRGHG